MKSIIDYSSERPRTITGVMVGITLLLALLAALPTLWPNRFPFLPAITVDTDPENMLPHDEPVRRFHDAMKRELSLHEMVVLGVVNEDDPNGVFNPESLRRIHELTEYAKTLQWPDPKDPTKREGVIAADIIAPSTVDQIEQEGPGSIRFEWLMPTPPDTVEEALRIRDRARRIPFLDGTLLAEDGKAIAIYLPITSKDVSHDIYQKLEEKIATFSGDDRFFITGLPVAEDTFGVEMFVQMAISAPLAMLVIFLLMLYFFRRLVLILSPLIIALVSVIWTMALLVISGNTIHIMSSMIPIFIMPISVLDAVHILSEFFDRYPEMKDRRETMRHVMSTLFAPMLYTSLTSIAGFLSLLLTPIPPVQVFGLFVAIGIFIAWVLTMVFVPAYVMLIPERRFENFGARSGSGEEHWLARLLVRLGGTTIRSARTILVFTLLASVVAIVGIQRIRVNDNPVRWFTPSHPIRVADRVLNEHFAGTYMAYLALEPEATQETLSSYLPGFLERLDRAGRESEEALPNAASLTQALRKEAQAAARSSKSPGDLLERLTSFVSDRLETAEGDDAFVWEDLQAFLGQEAQRSEIFKQPEVLRYIEGLQRHLQGVDVVGKSNSIVDIVKTVYRELLGGGEDAFRVPDTPQAVGQALITFQNSHRPQDVWHFVTPDYRKTSLWVQLKSGDNRDMMKAVAAVERYLSENPPPIALQAKWFGLTYINVIWQEKMVFGMLESFLGCFVVAYLMVAFLFRSWRWGAIAMIPMTVTIAFIYGVIGLVGKDYDMPVAVLSSLTLGLAIDFAIHFLSRIRIAYYTHHLSENAWEKTVAEIFQEPARAISRNIVVIACGFLPLLAAPLVPYQTVGFLLASILVFSGVATLVIIPALMRYVNRWFF